jgi:hypothetical protein
MNAFLAEKESNEATYQSSTKMVPENVVFYFTLITIRACRCEGKAIKRLHSSKCTEVFGIYEAESVGMVASWLPLFELARVPVRFDHVARIIVNANHSGARPHPAHHSGVG